MGLSLDFAGFPPHAQTFLTDLRAHNDRDWFAAHRATYDAAVRAPAEAFVAGMEPWLSALAGRPMNGKIYRIHRDVRFSKDKTPYNAHLHIGFAPAAAPHGPGFYFGLEPGRLVPGAGAFEFPGAGLDAYRAAVARPDSGAELESILARLAGFRIEGAELKRAPAPYPADHPRAALLRRKGLSAWRDLADPEVLRGPALGQTCEATFARLAPLHDWLAAHAAA